MSEEVTITLSRNEALVLFEFLSRFTERQQLDIRDQAEQRVLWDILADLETALPEPLAPDYHQHLQRARESIRDTMARLLQATARWRFVSRFSTCGAPCLSSIVRVS